MIYLCDVDTMNVTLFGSGVKYDASASEGCKYNAQEHYSVCESKKDAFIKNIQS